MQIGVRPPKRRLSRRLALSWNGMLASLVASACQRRPALPEPIMTPSSSQIRPGMLSWMFSEDPKNTGMERASQIFQEQYPQVRIEILHVPSAYEDKLRAMLAGGQAPDVARLNDDYVAHYACRNLVQPLNDFLIRDKVRREEFFDAEWKACDWEGKTWALAIGFTPQVMWVNVSLFQRVGLPVPTVPYISMLWTWDDYLAAAKRLTLDIDGDGQVDVWGTSILHSGSAYLYFPMGNGADVLTPDLKRFGYTEPRAYGALQWIADLIHVHKVHPPIEIFRQVSGLDLFQQGKVAILGSAGRAALFRQNITSFEWDIVPIARGLVRRGHTSTPLLFMLPRDGRQHDTAWAFLYWLTSNPAQESIAQKGDRMPPRKAQAASSLFLDPALLPRNQRLWLDANEGASWEPKHPQREKIRAIYRPALQPIWTGEKTARQAMEEVAPAVNAVIAEPC
jgi:multiple sugar transport system substrate-binding protein